MLQQQLRQRDEDIAAKAAEIGDLKERVAELEKLKQEQQQLLSLKDSELAAAQQRLAEHDSRAADEAARYALRQKVKHLTQPDAMGERFQAMGFARDVEFSAAFLLGDQTWRL
mgnify:CR=1 FL=1